MTPQKEKLVSNWCQNRKNHNFKRNKILQTIDFKWFAKKISKNQHSILDIANKEDYNIVKDKKRIAQPVVQMTVRHMHCRFLLYNILGKQKGSVQNG